VRLLLCCSVAHILPDLCRAPGVPQRGCLGMMRSRCAGTHVIICGHEKCTIWQADVQNMCVLIRAQDIAMVINGACPRQRKLSCLGLCMPAVA
jgi:hypothetical protein